MQHVCFEEGGFKRDHQYFPRESLHSYASGNRDNAARKVLAFSLSLQQLDLTTVAMPPIKMFYNAI